MVALDLLLLVDGDWENVSIFSLSDASIQEKLDVLFQTLKNYSVYRITLQLVAFSN